MDTCSLRTHESKCGVPQGSFLDPLLFNMHMLCKGDKTNRATFGNKITSATRTYAKLLTFQLYHSTDYFLNQGSGPLQNTVIQLKEQVFQELAVNTGRFQPYCIPHCGFHLHIHQFNTRFRDRKGNVTCLFVEATVAASVRIVTYKLC